MLRALAVLVVFFSHLNILLAPNRWRELAGFIGQLGVLMFFVHTALVLMRSLERMPERGSALWRAFYVRRAFRIYPLSMICVLFAFLVALSPHLASLNEPVEGPRGPWTLGELVANLTLTQNLSFSESMIGPLWTLPLEVQMYIALPFFFVFLKDRPVRWAIGAWALALLVAFLQPHFSDRLSVFGYGPCFLGGIVAWRVSEKVAPYMPGWAWPICLAAAMTAWLLLVDRTHGMAFRSIFGLVLGLLIPMVQEIPWARVAALGQKVAQYSYGIYLTHMPVFFFSFHFMKGAPVPVQWSLAATLAVAMPVLLYHFVEHPMILVGKRVAAAARGVDRHARAAA